MLKFRCEQCELDFDANPDGTGYEQAPCPSCGYLCVTVDFIEEERRRNRFPLPRFTIRTLLLTVATICVFLGLSVAFPSDYSHSREYGFPFPAVNVPHNAAVSVDFDLLVMNALVFLVTVLGLSYGLTWLASRVTARRTT